MITEEKYQKAINLISKTILGDPNRVRHILMDKLVENGKFTPMTINEIISDISTIHTMDKPVIILFYLALEKTYHYPRHDTIFSAEEINQSRLFRLKEIQDTYPLIFHNVERLSSNEQYCFFAHATEIATLVNNKILQVRSDMQRESHISIYNNQIISHVEYNNDVALAISESLQQGAFFANALRWHLVSDEESDYYYDEKNKILKINKGFLANIDGQHRSYGILYACTKIEKPNIIFPILFTTGDVGVAQSIIYQEEQRTPLKLSVVESYKTTPTSNIVRSLITDNQIKQHYKIIPQSDNILQKWNILTQEQLTKDINQMYRIEDNYIQNTMITNNIKDILMLLPELKIYMQQITESHTSAMIVALSKYLETYNITDKYKQLKSILEQAAKTPNYLFQQGETAPAIYKQIKSISITGGDTHQ